MNAKFCKDTGSLSHANFPADLLKEVGVGAFPNFLIRSNLQTPCTDQDEVWQGTRYRRRLACEIFPLGGEEYMAAPKFKILVLVFLSVLQRLCDMITVSSIPVYCGPIPDALCLFAYCFRFHLAFKHNYSSAEVYGEATTNTVRQNVLYCTNNNIARKFCLFRCVYKI